MVSRFRSTVLASVVLALAATAPAAAEVSAFVATVGFDASANLERGQGVGLRWGKAGGLLGGETSLLVARPDRVVDWGTAADRQATTAIFYEGRMLVTLPVGQIRPFAGVGFGAITLTEAKVKAPVSANDAVAQAFDAISGLQTNSAFSYGGGVRYALGQRLDLRADVRQYMVFSVKGVVGNQVKDAIASQTGIELARDHTVRYNELSVGICARF
jgi:hypothetical protein